MHISQKIKENKLMYITMFVILLVEIIPIVFIRSLTVDSSEYNVIAMGAGIAGVDWKSTINAGYYYGYVTSLVYSILFLFKPLYTHPIVLYQLLLGLNAIFNVLCAYFLYKTLVVVNNNKIKEIYIALTTLTTSLFISKVILSKSASNENLYVLFYYIAIYFLIKNIGEKSKKLKIRNSIFIAASSIGAYANNNRGIILILMVCFAWAFFMIFKKQNVLELISFVITLAAFFILHKFLKSYIVNEFFAARVSGELINNDSNAIFENLFNMFNLTGLKMFIMGTVGWLYAFIVSTYGLGCFAMVYMVSTVKDFVWNKKKKYTDSEHMLAILCFMFMAAAIILGCLFYYNSYYDMVNQLDTTIGTNRVDKLVYGRYLSTIKPIVISFTLYMMIKYRENLKLKSIVSISIAGVFCFVFQFFVAPRMTDRQYAATDINEFAVFLKNFGTNPKFGTVNQNIFPYISIALIILMTIITVLWLIKKNYILYGVTIVVGIVMYIEAMVTCAIPKSEYYYNLVDQQILSVIENVDEETPIYLNNAYLYQFRCGALNINKNTDRDSFPSDNFILLSSKITTYTEIQAPIYSINDMKLYAVGNKLKDSLEQKGFALKKVSTAGK